MRTGFLTLGALFLAACVSDAPTENPMANFEEVESARVVDAPKPQPGRFYPGDRDAIDRGAYLVQLLGCGACHTNGALDGVPDMNKALAGSTTGIAYSSPLTDKHPGVVFPPNITPDEETGIGLWTDTEIANAIRAGTSRHGSRRLVTMPWQGYARINDDDIAAIIAYLRSIEPISNDVPGPVRRGERTRERFVYFGVYQNKIDD